MILTVVVGLAAAAGAVSRYLLDQIVQHQHDSSLPWGTFIVNVSGSFLLGLVTGLSLHHGLPTSPTTVLGIGFLGGYTTWSTFAFETVSLAETGALLQAATNVVGSLAVGLAAAAAGLGLALL
jgi:fluoride exporter